MAVKWRNKKIGKTFFNQYGKGEYHKGQIWLTLIEESAVFPKMFDGKEIDTISISIKKESDGYGLYQNIREEDGNESKKGD